MSSGKTIITFGVSMQALAAQLKALSLSLIKAGDLVKFDGKTFVVTGQLHDSVLLDNYITPAPDITMAPVTPKSRNQERREELRRFPKNRKSMRF